MNTEVETRFNELEKAREEFLDALKGWNDDQLKAIPPDGSWSVNQVLEHILTSETGTIGYMKKKSSGGWDALEKTGAEQIANSQALNSRLGSDLRIKAPSVLPEPTNNFTLAQLTAQWSRLHVELKEFLETVNPMHYDRLVFRQPAAGMLNILHTVEFLTHHIRHHLPQLQRIKEAHGF